MLKEFSDWKSIGFIIYLIVINMIGIIFSTFFRIFKLIKNNKFFEKKSITIIGPFILVCFLSLITFIISLIYYKIDKYKEVWDYLYMLNVSCFK